LQAGSTEATADANATDARGRWAVVAAFALIAAAYLSTVSPVWFVHPDSAKYLGLARSLARGDGYTFNHVPHGKYVPVLPLLLAPVWAMMGRHFVAMQVVVALTGLGALAATYALVRGREGARVAFWVLVLTATCGWFWTASSLRLLSEAPYACFSLLALWYAEKQTRAATFSIARWVLAGVLGAVAIYTHMVGVALIPALVAGALLARGKERPWRQRLGASALVGLITMAAAGYWLYRGWQLPHLSSYTHHVHLADSQPLQYQFFKMALRLKEWPATVLSLREEQFVWPAGLALFAVFLIPGLVKGFVQHRSCSEFYLVCFFFVSAIFGGESGLERYATPVVPLIFYFGYLSLTVVGRWVAWAVLAVGLHAKAAAKAPPVLLVVAILFVLCNATYNRVKGSRGASKFDAERQERAREELARWEDLASAIAEKVPAGAKIYPASGGLSDIVHFLTERKLFDLARIHRQRLPLFQSMVAWDADYMIYDHRGRSLKRFEAVLRDYPECFELLYATDEDMARLYRLDKERVEEVLKHLKETSER
jgi:hypothetical protein